MLQGIIIFLTFLVILCLLPIKFYLHIYREPNEVKIDVKITLWIIPFKIRLVNPLTKIFWNLSHNKPWQKKAPQDVSFQRIPWRRFIARIVLLRKVFNPIYKSANAVFRKISSYIKLKEFQFYTEFSSSDAARTAISVGLVWWGLTMLYGRIRGIFDTEVANNKINVVPNFQKEEYLLIDSRCIFELRLGHIIIVVYEMLKSIRQIYSLLRRVSA